MTAPAAPTAPAPVAGQSTAPAAPAVATPPAPAGPKRAGDLLHGSNDEILSRFGLSQLAEEARDEAAKTPAPETPETETADEPVVAETAEPAAAETAEKVETPATPKREPIAQFQVFDKDGELEIPELTIAFKANGKDRQEPLDKVVRLAMQGYYNEEREQQVVQTRQESAQIKQQNEQVAAYLATVRSELHAMLSDTTDQRYQQLKAEHARANTPEARAERAERALAAERSRGLDAQTAQQVTAFSSTLQQHLTELTKAHPEVSFEEVVGRFNTLIAPLTKAGQVPVAAFNDVARLVDEELTPWVQHRHESRIEAATKRDAVANEKVTRERKARESASILAKRKIARAIPGTADTIPQPVRPAAPEKPKYKKAGDILGDVTRIVQTSTG